MNKHAVQFLSPQRSQQLTELAERARFGLSRYTGVPIDYDAVGLQALDEWIERYVRQFPRPSQEIQMVWCAFLGETFRRRHDGQWSVDNAGPRPRLGIVCPTQTRDPLFIDVMGQITQRIRKGMAESLAFYYTIKGIEIRSA